MGHQWMHFLFGTPQRLLRTLVAFVLIACVVNPAIGDMIIQRILNALTPFIILGFFVFVLLRIIGVGGGGGRRGH